MIALSIMNFFSIRCGAMALTIALALIALPQVSFAREGGNLWSALAVEKANPSHYGWAVDKSDAESAEEAALEHCTGDCEIVLKFSTPCGAYAQGETGGYGYARNYDKETTQAAALDQCRSQDRGCRIRVWACSRVMAGNRQDREPQYYEPPPPPPRSYSEPSYRRDSEPSYRHESLSFIDRLDRQQRRALAAGCEYRYNAVPDKLRACLQGTGGNYEAALTQGCEQLFSGEPERLRRCVTY
jgi:hypothetical protein